MEKFDSRPATMAHIGIVWEKIFAFTRDLNNRGLSHYLSKLGPPEVDIFDEYTPKLAGTTYGSDEYKQYLAEMTPALKHHYAHNRHHPEHFIDGINGMTLIDLVEMFCDWWAASERHNDGDLMKSIEINAERFGLSPQLHQILKNTAEQR